ncbi:MAG: nuclear transport factor 2 family protein [Mycobacterium sp.]|nr:nuclear transport factor 2 family protein [Mycobacterium sp.]
MLSLAEISDRLEIQQLLVDYATAIDQRRFDDLDRIFTPDAYIDYRAMGGIDGVYPQVKAWLAQVLPNFPAFYHLVGNFDITLSGDTASGRTMCFNPMQLSAGPADPGARGSQVLFCALWYDDEFVRTAQGWRLTRRVETKCLDKLV